MASVAAGSSCRWEWSPAAAVQEGDSGPAVPRWRTRTRKPAPSPDCSRGDSGACLIREFVGVSRTPGNCQLTPTKNFGNSSARAIAPALTPREAALAACVGLTCPLTGTPTLCWTTGRVAVLGDVGSGSGFRSIVPFAARGWTFAASLRFLLASSLIRSCSANHATTA